MREHLSLPADPELAARAQQLTERVQTLTQTRSDAVDTAAAELRRIERDLHDGAQARLVALGMSLQAAERLFASNPEAALALVTEAKESSSRALTELRDLVRGIYPPVLADRGLGDAVRALALDTPLPVARHRPARSRSSCRWRRRSTSRWPRRWPMSPSTQEPVRSVSASATAPGCSVRRSPTTARAGPIRPRDRPGRSGAQAGDV